LTRAIEDDRYPLSPRIRSLKTLISRRSGYDEGWFAAPLFDIEDEYFVKIDLWRIGSIAITLLDLFYGVNTGRNVITIVDNFVPVFQQLAAKDATLREGMASIDRHKRAMEKKARRAGQ
jgi:hypothetical protein